MKPETQFELLEWLDQALETAHGIELQFATADEAKLFRAKLYAARKGFDQYTRLSFSQQSNMLWIMLGEEKNDQAT